MSPQSSQVYMYKLVRGKLAFSLSFNSNQKRASTQEYIGREILSGYLGLPSAYKCQNPSYLIYLPLKISGNKYQFVNDFVLA